MTADNKKHITLINTVHGQVGACNLNALYQIIERINPDIIFEEIPPCFFDKYYTTETMCNLETDTINQYLETHRIEHIPVDIDTKYLPSRFCEKNHYFMKTIENRRPLYRNLMYTENSYRFKYGFKYLNSDCAVNLNNQIYKTYKRNL